MPNHVDQDLEVSGPIDKLLEFKEFAKENGKELSANKFILYPKEFVEKDNLYKQLKEVTKISKDYSIMNNIKDGFNSGGYEWCCNNWGTKWGIYDCSIIDEDLDNEKGFISYNFLSAWSPAILIIKAMAAKFPELEFNLKYFECGMGFQGTLVIKNNIIIEEEQSEYSGNRGG